MDAFTKLGRSPFSETRGRAAPITVAIGGLGIQLEGLRARVAAAARKRYARFASDSPPALILTTRPDVVEGHVPAGPPRVERTGDRAYQIRYGALNAEIDLATGRGTAVLPESVYVVDSLLRICMTVLALEHDALLLHASGVLVGSTALVFFGPSGVGKSTAARRVARANVLSDEITAIFAPSGGGARASGTPFHGDFAACAPISAPTRALVRLSHGQRDALTPMSDGAAARALLGATLFFSDDDRDAERLLSVASRVCAAQTHELESRRHTNVPSFVTAELDRLAIAPGAPTPAAGSGQ